MSKIKIDKKYYNDGKAMCEWPYKNNLIHGIVKWWRVNGQLWSEEEYQNGQRHGIAKFWYYNGKFNCEKYYLYENKITKEEYRKHILMEQLACLK